MIATFTPSAGALRRHLMVAVLVLVALTGFACVTLATQLDSRPHEIRIYQGPDIEITTTTFRT